MYCPILEIIYSKVLAFLSYSSIYKLRYMLSDFRAMVSIRSPGSPLAHCTFIYIDTLCNTYSNSHFHATKICYILPYYAYVHTIETDKIDPQ